MNMDDHCREWGYKGNQTFKFSAFLHVLSENNVFFAQRG